MKLDQWLKAFDTLSGIAAASRRLRAGPERPEQGLTPGGALGQIEARLAGVVVAALKEAFDRDRARLDLERTHIEAERHRAEEALRLELLRQAGDRALFQLRLMAIMSVGIWMISTILVVWLPSMREATPRLLLGLGWASLIGALAGAFAAHTGVLAWLAASRMGTTATDLPHGGASSAVPWLLIVGLGLTAASLIAAL